MSDKQNPALVFSLSTPTHVELTTPPSSTLLHQPPESFLEALLIQEQLGERKRLDRSPFALFVYVDGMGLWGLGEGGGVYTNVSKLDEQTCMTVQRHCKPSKADSS